jgi:GTPase SAR1 family protein
VTNKKTLNEIQTFYEEVCRIKDTEDFPKILIGNKCDILESERGEKGVSSEMGKKFGMGIYAKFMETSALNRINIDELFTEIMNQIYDYKFLKVLQKDEKKEKKQNLFSSSTSSKEDKEDLEIIKNLVKE